MRVGRVFLACAVVGACLSVPQGASAATFRYPSARCDTTLQECINEVPAGSVIRIAKETVNERITINKSLTLTRAPGSTPAIGGPTPRVLRVRSPQGKKTDVTISNITVTNTTVDVAFAKGRGHRFRLLNVNLFSPAGQRGLLADSEGPYDVVVKNSTIQADNEAVAIGTGADFGQTNVLFQGNLVSSLDIDESQMGLNVFGTGAGTLNARIHSNVLYDLAGQDAGSPAGLFASALEDVEAHFDISNNTIDDIQSVGVNLVAPPGDGAPQAHFNFFNNSITDSQSTLFLPEENPHTSVANGYNNFHGNTSNAVGYGDWEEGPGVMSVEPAFVDEVGGDYRLQPGSPLRNQGKYLVPGGVSSQDAANNARVNEGEVDIGAYEIGSRKGCTIIGTGAADEINGTARPDVICGDAGNDTIFGRGGNDRLLGAGGADDLNGGAGGDDLLGGPGPDDLRARDGVRGNDDMFGNAGADDCSGDPEDSKSSC